MRLTIFTIVIFAVIARVILQGVQGTCKISDL